MKTNQLYKGSLATIVLKLLGDNGRMYGYQITQEVKNISAGKFRVTEGALYPMLHRFEAKGLLSVEMEMCGKRMRKYYSLTQNGKKEVVCKLSEMQEFIKNMQSLFNHGTETA